MASRRTRSTRSYVLEFGLTAIAILAVYWFLTNGGPVWFGEWFSDFIGAP